MRDLVVVVVALVIAAAPLSSGTTKGDIEAATAGFGAIVRIRYATRNSFALYVPRRCARLLTLDKRVHTHTPLRAVICRGVWSHCPVRCFVFVTCVAASCTRARTVPRRRRPVAV